MKILIVDDIEENLYLLETLLKGGGYEVVIAKDGLEALVKLKEESVDLIISDILMPKMDGFQFCRECKKDDRFKKIPFIFYTATYTDKKDEEFALSLGADRFILKPKEPEAFLKILNETIEENKKGTLIAPKELIKDEEIYFERYSKRLIHKLEKKMLDLEKANKILQEKEEKIYNLNQFQENIIHNANLWINVLDEKANVVLWNEAAEKMSGYSATEVIGHDKIWSWLYPDEKYRKEITTKINAIIEEGEVAEDFETKIACKDGKIKFISWYSRNLKNPQGSIFGSVALGRDITERKRAIETIRENENRFRELFNHMSSGVGIYEAKDSGQDFIIKDFNRAGERIEKVKKENIVGKSVLEVFPGLKDFGLFQVFQEVYQTGKPQFYPVSLYQDQRISGWRENYVYKLPSGEIVSVYDDITKRKQSEDIIKLQLAEISNYYKNIPIGLAVLDRDLRYLKINDMLAQINGISAKEHINKTVKEIVPDLELQALKISAEILRSGEPIRNIEFTGETLAEPGVKHVWLEGWYPLKDDSDKITGFSIIVQDITARKQSVEALKEAEARYRTVFENTGTATVIIEENMIISMANSQCEKLSGYSKEEIENKIKWTDFVVPEDLEEMKKYHIARRKAGEKPPTEYEFLMMDKKGVIKNIFLKISIIPGSKKSIASLVDITQLKQSEEKLKKTMDVTLETMSNIIEAKDPYTAGHQQRVSQLATAIAKEINLSQDKIEGVRIASLIHDIGKIGIPTEILSKPTKLSDIEFSLIKEHPQIGHDILKSNDFSHPIAQIILQHHERLNGSGYPNNLKGDKILPEAKIIAVADVIEAMSSHRPYRPALGNDKALEEISQNKGILYDPDIVDACMKLFKEKEFKFE